MSLKQILVTLQGELAKAQARNCFLEEQFRLAQHQWFGASSETYPGQGELFNEAEAFVEQTPGGDDEQITVTKKKPKRQALPKDLPRETVVHDIQDKICACCGGELHQMGDERSEKLEFIPAQVKVIEHVRLKYSCRQCESHGTATDIQIAPLPSSTIPKGIATASLLSQIIISKYQYGLPLYRQESLFKQYGIVLSRQTMSAWMLKSAELLKPLYQRLYQVLLKQRVIHGDETTVKVIKEDKATSYMWVYCTGTDSPTNGPIPNIVLYDYQPSRAGQCTVDFLDGFSGYLQVDGYAGYDQTGATLVGCWPHARRKFIEAQKAQAKGKTG